MVEEKRSLRNRVRNSVYAAGLILIEFQLRRGTESINVVAISDVHYFAIR